MRAGKAIRWAVLGLLAALVVTAAGLFGLASYRPGRYRPLHLSPAEQDQVVGAFVDHLKYFDQAGSGRPFEWSISATQANAYLAAIDAIAALRDDRASPTAEMEEAGFTAPAVDFRDGLLTLMVESKRHRKIISLDLDFPFNAEGDLTVRIRAMRIGALTVPRFVLAGSVENARAKLAEDLSAARGAGRSPPGAPVGELATVLRRLLEALEGRYVRPELIWRVGARHRVLVDGIDLSEGQATLHISPVRAAPASATSADP